MAASSDKQLVGQDANGKSDIREVDEEGRVTDGSSVVPVEAVATILTGKPSITVVFESEGEGEDVRREWESGLSWAGGKRERVGDS